ncbi:unnamed protein product, partial [Symbiodinium necroappetens]
VPAKENDNRVVPQANVAGKHSPGVYRCIHAPRVAIRAAPAANAEVLDTIRPGDLVRVAEIEAGHWARLDDDEVWARWTMNWPRWPKGVTEDGEDIGAGAASKAAVPSAAYILIDGTQVGLKTQLIERLPDDEAEKAQWPFGKALEHHCAEVNAAYQRQVPEAAKALRQRFVDAALKYVGIPYHRSYHDPSSGKCKPGSKLKDAPLFLDNIQLVQKVIEDLKQEFGFLLISNCKPVHCRATLPISFEDPADCEPGDLIFHEELDVDGAPSGRISHVEIFIGGSTGRESLGSMPWNAHPRTREKDGVQIFEDYRIAKETGKADYRLHCHSIRTWLLSEERIPSIRHRLMNRLTSLPNLVSLHPQPILPKSDAAGAAFVQQRVLGSCCSVPDLQTIPDPTCLRASCDASAATSSCSHFTSRSSCSKLSDRQSISLRGVQ